jgi:hypothetical protein
MKTRNQRIAGARKTPAPARQTCSTTAAPRRPTRKRPSPTPHRPMRPRSPPAPCHGKKELPQRPRRHLVGAGAHAMRQQRRIDPKQHGAPESRPSRSFRMAQQRRQPCPAPIGQAPHGNPSMMALGRAGTRRNQVSGRKAINWWNSHGYVTRSSNPQEASLRGTRNPVVPNLPPHQQVKAGVGRERGPEPGRQQADQQDQALWRKQTGCIPPSFRLPIPTSTLPSGDGPGGISRDARTVRKGMVHETVRPNHGSRPQQNAPGHDDVRTEVRVVADHDWRVGYPSSPPLVAHPTESCV